MAITYPRHATAAYAGSLGNRKVESARCKQLNRDREMRNPLGVGLLTNLRMAGPRRRGFGACMYGRNLGWTWADVAKRLREAEHGMAYGSEGEGGCCLVVVGPKVVTTSADSEDDRDPARCLS